MSISAGLVAKAAAGIGTAGLGVTALYFGGDYLNNTLSIYDKALIAFLEDNKGNDIVFEVKKITTNSGTDSTSDLDANDITFSGTTPSNPVTVKVKVSTTDSSLKKGNDSNSPASDINKIKKLGKNESSGWEWE